MKDNNGNTELVELEPLGRVRPQGKVSGRENKRYLCLEGAPSFHATSNAPEILRSVSVARPGCLPALVKTRSSAYEGVAWKAKTLEHLAARSLAAARDMASHTRGRKHIGRG